MPVHPTYPGVYVEELPSGVRTISGVATSITAFVGYTRRGPVDRALRIFNMGDFERQFGGLDRESEVSYAIHQFFLNGGTDAYVVRAAQGVQSAKVSLKDVGGSAVLNASAATPGSWGNNLRMTVDYQTSNPESTFNLIITRLEGKDGTLVPVEVELYRNLSLNSLSSSYVVRVVNSDSKLVRLERTAGLAFTEKGYSLSGRLNPFPALTAADNSVELVLDGRDRVTLFLADPASVNDLDKLKTALEAAAGMAGVAGRMTITRVNALGAANATGDFLKVTSTDASESSAIQFLPASSGELAAKCRLGANKGGREKEGAAFHRPAQSGTTSADLSDILGNTITGGMKIAINDHSTGAVVELASANATLPATVVGTALRDALVALIQTINHPAAKGAQVELMGNCLRILTASPSPNTSILFTDQGGNGATAARLTGTGSFVNLQEYSFAGGAVFGGQAGSTPGGDGSAPDANSLIGNYGAKTGIYALRDVDLFNLLVLPRISQLSEAQAKSVMAAATTFCEERRAFFIVDPAPNKTWDQMVDYVSGLGLNSRNAATYFPAIQFADPLDGFRLRPMPPSGMVAGVMARTDAERGVWKAPAGTEATLRGAQGLSYTLTDQENGVLNPQGINCLRIFPVHGRVIWGSRTLRGADAMSDDYKYIPVRRLALFIEESLYRGMQWAVFEPNDEPLWAQIRLNAGAFLQNLFRQGAFQGTSPREAYFVKCDKETTTQNDINLGIVNVVVGFAPLKPAEFVILKLQQMAGQVET